MNGKNEICKLPSRKKSESCVSNILNRFPSLHSLSCSPRKSSSNKISFIVIFICPKITSFNSQVVEVEAAVAAGSLVQKAA